MYVNLYFSFFAAVLFYVPSKGCIFIAQSIVSKQHTKENLKVGMTHLYDYLFIAQYQSLLERFQIPHFFPLPPTCGGFKSPATGKQAILSGSVADW